jgi:hypothetical protein
MSALRVNDHMFLRGFAAIMSMDNSATNIRRAKATIESIDKLSKGMHRDNVHHMYDKRIHRNAGEFKVVGKQVNIEPSIDINGPVTINITDTKAAAKKKAAK